MKWRRRRRGEKMVCNATLNHNAYSIQLSITCQHSSIIIHMLSRKKRTHLLYTCTYIITILQVQINPINLLMPPIINFVCVYDYNEKSRWKMGRWFKWKGRKYFFILTKLKTAKYFAFWFCSLFNVQCNEWHDYFARIWWELPIASKQRIKEIYVIWNSSIDHFDVDFRMT